MSIHPLESIFHPQSIAVIGSSNHPDSQGHGFTAPLLEYGYTGKIYPVNPKHPEILGLKAYADIRDIPGSVDHVISCIPASKVLDLIKSCPEKGVNAVHLYTARFSETGRKEAIALEQEILREAKKGGVRLIGPNCMGLYYPAEGISFSDAMPKASGKVGLISQSGQFAEEFGRNAAMRGVYLSKAVSYGNAIDLNECDFLDYFSHDPETKVIFMYIEGVRDGENFFGSLRNAASIKPVIILKGGRGKSGTRATASHTASLAGSRKIWDTLISQAGAVSAANFVEMIDLAVSFNFLPPIFGLRVGVAGGGGGTSVLAADQCEEAGLDVIPLPAEIREELKGKGSAIWDWIGNPADMSIRDTVDFVPGTMLEMMARNNDFDFLVAIMSDPHHERQRGMTAGSYLEQFKLKELDHKPVLAVVPDKSPGIEDFDHWSWKVMCGIRSNLIAARIPFYPSVWCAAAAARKLVAYYQSAKSAPSPCPAS